MHIENTFRPGLQPVDNGKVTRGAVEPGADEGVETPHIGGLLEQDLAMKLGKLIPLMLATLACGATGPVAHAAPQLAQKRQRAQVFHTLGHDSQAQFVAQMHNRADDGTVLVRVH